LLTLGPALNPITSLDDFHLGKGTFAERVEQPLTDHETEWLLLANALTPREYILNLYTLLNVLPARSLPGYHRTGPAREVPLRKDIIRDMRQALKALHLRQIEADTLRGGMGT
jgi:hypothetical protein